MAKEGYGVAAVELVHKNLEILREHGKGIPKIASYQDDAVNLAMLQDESYDATLLFGLMYHLYEEGEVDKTINEAIRVTKKGGVIFSPSYRSTRSCIPIIAMAVLVKD